MGLQSTNMGEVRWQAVHKGHPDKKIDSSDDTSSPEKLTAGLHSMTAGTVYGKAVSRVQGGQAGRAGTIVL